MLQQYSDKVKINLKKAAGQLALIAKMIDGERYCLDVPHQDLVQTQLCERRSLGIELDAGHAGRLAGTFQALTEHARADLSWSPRDSTRTLEDTLRDYRR